MIKRFLKLLYKIYWVFLIAVSLPLILAEYFKSDTGKAYNVGFIRKVRVLIKMVLNNVRIVSASNFIEHITMATKILNVPKDVEGCVVECGSYKGGSTVNISLVCNLCDREFEVFDSFAGLPHPSQQDKVHALVDSHELHTYEKGAWTGTLDEVKGNVSKYGNIEMCNFNVGYFEDTLPEFNKKCVFVFLDVDLRRSLETCLRFLWNRLQDNCHLYTHEAHHPEIATLFYDQEWWLNNLNFEAPGLVGAGCGLGLIPSPGAFKSAIGYTVKNPAITEFKEVPQTGLE